MEKWWTSWTETAAFARFFFQEIQGVCHPYLYWRMWSGSSNISSRVGFCQAFQSQVWFVSTPCPTPPPLPSNNNNKDSPLVERNVRGEKTSNGRTLSGVPKPPPPKPVFLHLRIVSSSSTSPIVIRGNSNNSNDCCAIQAFRFLRAFLGPARKKIHIVNYDLLKEKTSFHHEHRSFGPKLFNKSKWHCEHWTCYIWPPHHGRWQRKSLNVV